MSTVARKPTQSGDSALFHRRETGLVGAVGRTPSFCGPMHSWPLGVQMKLRKFKAAVGVGSLTATVALLAGLSSAHAQGAPGGGSFPGSILIPGTNTSFKTGGYAKWDYTYDFSQEQNIVGGFSATALAIDGCAACGIGGAAIAPGAQHTVHGGSQMTASESRFNFE